MEEEYRGTAPKWLVLLCLLLVLAGGGAFFFLYFTVDAVEVMETTHYTEEEIRDLVLTGPAAGNSVLAPRFLSRENVTDIPYVDAIHVTAVDHHRLSITVREKKAVGCFPYLDNYIYFDRNGVFFYRRQKEGLSDPLFFEPFGCQCRAEQKAGYQRVSGSEHSCRSGDFFSEK